LAQFWLQPVPYADLNGDNYGDWRDYAILHRIEQGDIWVAKFNWLCENTYFDGSTELVEGWTYTVWESEPVKRDLHPEVPGFNWADEFDKPPIAQMNYIFFEEMFPYLIIEDPNEPLYSGYSAYDTEPPSIVGWEIASTHGADVGELWQPIEDGYVEPRLNGIEKLRVWFDRPMNTDYPDPNAILITSWRGVNELPRCSIEWDGRDCMIITLYSALPDEDTYTIWLGDSLWSLRGHSLDGIHEICVTALKGDVDASRSVTSEDILAIKSHTGEPVDILNARFDVNASGSINSQDMLVVYARVGNSAPSCQP